MLGDGRNLSGRYWEPVPGANPDGGLSANPPRTGANPNEGRHPVLAVSPAQALLEREVPAPEAELQWYHHVGLSSFGSGLFFCSSAVVLEICMRLTAAPLHEYRNLPKAFAGEYDRTKYAACR